MIVRSAWAELNHSDMIVAVGDVGAAVGAAVGSAVGAAVGAAVEVFIAIWATDSGGVREDA